MKITKSNQKPTGEGCMAETVTQKPLTIIEAAEYTRLKKSYLYKLVHLGKIPCYKPTGGRVFFRREELEELEELEEFIFRGKQSADYELTVEADRVLNGGRK
jgi:excisionase family DNA binding protein